MIQLPIYMDNHATTRVDPRVLEAMLPFFTDKYGNAASRHHVFGQQAEAAVEAAREQVAALINASPKEIVFTSGATESDNLAIKGVAGMHRHKGHIATTAIEHHAVLDPCKRLERDDFQVTLLVPDRFGQVSADQVAAALTDQPILVSVMAANNEIGTLNPVGDIGKLCKERGVLFHTDAVQAAGKLPLDVEEMGIDLLSLSAHKMHGPKGVGALYVRKHAPRVRLEPMFDGGGHERGMRSGTLPVPLIVGFGKACELCRLEMAVSEKGTGPLESRVPSLFPEAESARIQRLRQKLQSGIMERLEDVYLNGHPVERLPGNLNLSFAYVHGDGLLMALKDVAVSSGSACTSANPEPSYVLKALGVDDELAHASIRFGLGRFNTEEEVDHVIDHVVATVQRLRAMSPLYELARSKPRGEASNPGGRLSRPPLAGPA
jgi:cysteine desulfurase